jgi:hypothetical protein
MEGHAKTPCSAAVDKVERLVEQTPSTPSLWVTRPGFDLVLVGELTVASVISCYRPPFSDTG